MKLSRTLLFLPLALAAVALAADKVTIAALVKDPQKHDGKTVLVKGTVAEFEQRTSRAGNDYYVFKLKDGKDQVNVYGQGKLNPAPKNGDTVEVQGRWQREKKVGNRTFTNEIGLYRNAKPAPFVKIVRK